MPNWRPPERFSPPWCRISTDLGPKFLLDRPGTLTETVGVQTILSGLGSSCCANGMTDPGPDPFPAPLSDPSGPSGGAYSPSVMGTSLPRKVAPTPHSLGRLDAPWCDGAVETGIGMVPRARTALSLRDRLSAILVRCGIRRMGYRVPPGLYALRAPGTGSPVMLSANYKLSFD